MPAVFRPYQGGRVDLRQRLAAILPETVGFARHEAAAYLLAGSHTFEETPYGRPGPAALALLGLPALVVSCVACVRRRDTRIAYLLYAPLFLVLYAWIGHREAWYFPSFVTFGVLTLFHGCVLTLDHGWELLRKRTGSVPSVLPALSWAAAGALLLTANNYGAAGGGSGKARLSRPRPAGQTPARRARAVQRLPSVAGVLNRRGAARAADQRGRRVRLLLPRRGDRHRRPVAGGAGVLPRAPTFGTSRAGR
jgi:hypothetical protein